MQAFFRYDTGMRIVLSTVFALLWLAECLVPAQAAQTLDIYVIDTEGGQSTLLVSPSGESLLIDTGFGGNNGRDPNRIVAAATAAGLKRIDYLLISHFHGDHFGGVEGLVQQLPVGTFLDHGPSVQMPDGKPAYPDPYAAAFAKAKHKVVAPGDKIPLKNLDITVVEAGGKPIDRKGPANPYCAGLEPRPENDKGEAGEDPQSVGVVVQLGKFRFLDLADLTMNRQLALLCPQNRVGKIDLYLTSRHGGDSPKAFYAAAPRVAIMNNGPRKGGSADGFRTVMASPGLEDLWQVHFAMANGKDANAPEQMIANTEEGEADKGLYLKASASADGSFTVTNPRNNYSKMYKAK
jgi:competence protein ComEC